jgi:hypothetical protein
MQTAEDGRVVSPLPPAGLKIRVLARPQICSIFVHFPQRAGTEQIKTRIRAAELALASLRLQVTVLNAVTAKIPMTAKTTIWLARARARPRGDNIPRRRRHRIGRIPVAVSS